jgi:fructose-1,6-bisphosphatase/inositol monophosphatase family enzyme
MPKGTVTVNPKLAVMRKVCAKEAPLMRRALGEMGRVQMNPVHAARMFDDTRAKMVAEIRELLEPTGLPVVIDGEITPAPLPEACWLIEPICGKRNFLHGRAPVGMVLACIENGEVVAGGVYWPQDDLLVYALPGLGVMGPERLRVAGRADARDSLLMLPAKTVDVINLKLLEKGEQLGLHTRKSGTSLFDVIEVAAGRADAAIATRLTPLEALLAKLFMAESAGMVTDFTGAALSVSSSGLVASNLKLHAAYLALVK